MVLHFLAGGKGGGRRSIAGIAMATSGPTPPCSENDKERCAKEDKREHGDDKVVDPKDQNRDHCRLAHGPWEDGCILEEQQVCA